MAQVEPPETTKLTGRHDHCCHAVAVIFTGSISECCGLNRNHPQRLGSGSSLSHEKEWNHFVPANHACFDFRTLRRLF
jgi:hypothetical protein